MMKNVCFIIFLAVLLWVFPSAQAATIVVDSIDQEVPLVNNAKCSLGEAIMAANTNSVIDTCVAGEGVNTDEIVLPENQIFSITLTNGGGSAFPPITSDIILKGNGSTLRREGDVVTRFFTLQSTKDIFIEDLSFEGGIATNGGAVYVVSGSHVYFNRAQFISNKVSLKGGAYYALNVTTHFNDSTFFGNKSDGTGGAIEASNNLFIIGSQFVDNQGNAGGSVSFIPVKNQYFQIKKSLFKNNMAQSNGGAIFGGSESFGFIESTVFEGNRVADNCGAGQCMGGAIIFSSGQTNNPLVIANSSFYQNVSGKGGALAVPNGKSFLLSTTIFDNVSSVGAGLFTSSQFGKIDLVNSIVVGNQTLSGVEANCNQVNSLGSNVVGLNCVKNGQASDVTGALSEDVIKAWVPGVQNLSHATLAENSPAINLGNTEYCIYTGDSLSLHLDEDQLAYLRDNACDAGSIEARCGDGIVHATLKETCDDGNLDDGDGCSSLCVTETVSEDPPVETPPDSEEPQKPIEQDDTVPDSGATDSGLDPSSTDGQNDSGSAADDSGEVANGGSSTSNGVNSGGGCSLSAKCLVVDYKASYLGFMFLVCGFVLLRKSIRC